MNTTAFQDTATIGRCLRRNRLTLLRLSYQSDQTRRSSLDALEAEVRAILCEKPIAATLADADRMVEACQSRGIKFGSGDLDRNLPQYWKALEIIESGELGEVTSINFIGGSGTEMSGGGCQLFSLMRMFAGRCRCCVGGWLGRR